MRRQAACDKARKWCLRQLQRAGRQTERGGWGEETGEGDRVNNRFLVAAAGKWQLPTG